MAVSTVMLFSVPILGEISDRERRTPSKLGAGHWPDRSLAMVTAMRLDGVHHVTAITADAQRNVDFYAGVLGLRLVKKTVNQDNPTVYHLFYADEKGDPGSDLTFFEYPGDRGRPGGGRDGPPDRVAGRLRRRHRLLGRAARRARGAGAARRRSPSVRRSRGPRARAGGPGGRRRAADRRASRDSGGACATGLRRRPRLRVRPGPERRAAREDAGVLAPRPGRRRRCVGGEGGEAGLDLRLRRAAGRDGLAGRGHRPSRRLGVRPWRSTRPGGIESSRLGCGRRR